MEETGCQIICGAPTTLAVKGIDDDDDNDDDVGVFMAVFSLHTVIECS